MLHLRKKGFALINTIIIISLVTTLGCFMFRLIKNNREMASIYYIDDDMFSIDADEEEIIYEFMKILNKKNENIQFNMNEKKEENNDEYEEEKKTYADENVNETGDSVISSSDKEDDYRCLFDADFEEENKGNKLSYNKADDRLILKINGEYDFLRIRELKYVIKGEKIILIPTPNYIDTNTNTDNF